MTSLVPETGPKHSPPVANAPPALPLQFDRSTATPPRNTLRTASASNNSSPPPVDSARSPAGHHASPSHESQVDGAPSPPSSTSRAGLTPGSPEQIRQALLNDPPRSRLPTAHIINATASPPAYQQTANPTAPTSNRELRFPRLTPTQEKFERTGKAVGYWLKLVWLDILFMLLTLAIMGAIMLWAPIFRWQRRYFPVEWDANYKVWRGPVDLSYPQEDFIISTLHAALILNLVPAAILYGIQIWVRDFWDFTAASFGLIKGVIILQFICVTLKQYIGEFRPIFMSVCGPLTLQPLEVTAPTPVRFATPLDCSRSALHGLDHRGRLMFAMQSFPSGHTATAFMVGTFLALYLNAKLKAFSSYHTSFWKIIAVLGPLIGAAFIAASLVSDRNHHVHDILLSIPLGVAIAILAYRAHYASLFDYKTNHLYLPWSVTNRSVTIANTAAVAGAQDGTGFQTEKKRNKTAVPWPRAPKSRSESEVHGLGTGLGLDRAADMNRRIYGPLILRGGRMRQDLFPEAREATLRGNGGSEIVLPNGNGDLARYPVEMDGTGAEVPPVRFQVEDWANETGSGAVRRRVNLSGGEMV